MSIFLRTICLLIPIGLIPLNGNSQEIHQQFFSLQNNSPSTLYDIFLFGAQIDSLTPGSQSQGHPFSYNPVTDDSMIYCYLKGVRYACYLHIPDKDLRKFSYIVEGVQNEVLYVEFSPVYD